MKYRTVLGEATIICIQAITPVLGRAFTPDEARRLNAVLDSHVDEAGDDAKLLAKLALSELGYTKQ